MTQQEILDALPESVLIRGNWISNSVMVDKKPLDLKASLKVRNHSPTGFNWGYSGSGPAQFALALLLLYLDKETVMKWYYDFKFHWVASLPQADFQGVYNLRLVMEQIFEKQKAKNS